MIVTVLKNRNNKVYEDVTEVKLCKRGAQDEVIFKDNNNKWHIVNSNVVAIDEAPDWQETYDSLIESKEDGKNETS